MLSPRIHCVICVQNVPAPTEAGIASEPSKRNVDFGSVRIWTDRWSIGSLNTDGSTLMFDEAHPEVCVDEFSSALRVAQSGLARYS